MRFVWLAILAIATGCGGTPASPQLPPANAADLLAWLATAQYQQWHCEPAPHPPRPPSPHSSDRICQNDLASGHGDGEYPVGASSVKELFDTGGNIRGYSVNRKIAQGATGATWYWFETISGTRTADGLGDSGAAKTICAACHALAGTGGRPGHDLVWTQVR